MDLRVEFDNEEIFYPISSNFTKHEEAQGLAKKLGKKSYKFVSINIEGISKQFLLED